MIDGLDIGKLTRDFKKSGASLDRLSKQLDSFLENIPEGHEDIYKEILDSCRPLKRRMSEAAKSGDIIEILKLQVECVELLTKYGTQATNTGT